MWCQQTKRLAITVLTESVQSFGEGQVNGSALFPSLDRVTTAKFTRLKKPTPSSNHPGSNFFGLLICPELVTSVAEPCFDAP